MEYLDIQYSRNIRKYHVNQVGINCGLVNISCWDQKNKNHDVTILQVTCKFKVSTVDHVNSTKFFTIDEK